MCLEWATCHICLKFLIHQLFLPNIDGYSSFMTLTYIYHYWSNHRFLIDTIILVTILGGGEFFMKHIGITDAETVATLHEFGLATEGTYQR